MNRLINNFSEIPRILLNLERFSLIILLNFIKIHLAKTEFVLKESLTIHEEAESWGMAE